MQKKVVTNESQESKVIKNLHQSSPVWKYSPPVNSNGGKNQVSPSKAPVILFDKPSIFESNKTLTRCHL